MINDTPYVDIKFNTVLRELSLIPCNLLEIYQNLAHEARVVDYSFKFRCAVYFHCAKANWILNVRGD